MLFDKGKLSIALDSIGSNFRKILLVNLTTNEFTPATVPDDELDIAKRYNILQYGGYWDWFCESDLLHQDDKKTCMDYRFEPNTNICYRRKFPDGWHWVLMEVFPTKEYTNDNKSCVLCVRDIHSIYQPQYERIAEKIGSTDQMTGLRNRASFEHTKKCCPNDKVGVVYADVNCLKYTNDNFGHAEGDKLIVKFANLLKINFASYKCFHISGDEFVVMAFGESLQEFLSKAIAFHHSIWACDDKPLASIGYSVGEAGIDTVDDTVKAAEQAMYGDKSMFYNRFPQFDRR